MTQPHCHRLCALSLLVCTGLMSAWSNADAPPGHEVNTVQAAPASASQPAEPLGEPDDGVATPEQHVPPPDRPHLPLTPYRAVYEGTYNGRSFGTEGHAELVALGDDRYRARVEVDNLIFDILEETTFRYQDGEFTPQVYHSRRDTLFTKRHKTVEFDWDNERVQWRYKKDKGSYALPADAVDAMTMELSVGYALRLSHEPRELQFLEADRKRIKPRRFQIKKSEMLTTELGELEVIQVEQQRDNASDRATLLWFAPALNYVLVRVVHLDDGDRFELNIQRYQPTEPS